ncbi:MAG: beta-propeller domain-containing protein, partial [Patescibacteria group bacterium]
MHNRGFVNIFLIVLLVVVVSVVGVIVFLGIKRAGNSLPPPIAVPTQPGTNATSTTDIVGVGNISGFKKFASQKEIKDYLSKSESFDGFLKSAAFMPRAMPGAILEEFGAPSSGIGMGVSLDSVSAPERVSETNVQVFGIDEPDIVKTDGKNIYASLQSYYFGRMMAPNIGISITEDSIAYPKQETKIINAFPPADLAKKSAI